MQDAARWMIKTAEALRRMASDLEDLAAAVPAQSQRTPMARSPAVKESAKAKARALLKARVGGMTRSALLSSVKMLRSADIDQMVRSGLAWESKEGSGRDVVTIVHYQV